MYRYIIYMLIHVGLVYKVTYIVPHNIFITIT